MDTKKVIAGLVGKFVDEILDIVRQLVDDSLATALKTVQSPKRRKSASVGATAVPARPSRGKAPSMRRGGRRVTEDVHEVTEAGVVENEGGNGLATGSPRGRKARGRQTASSKRRARTWTSSTTPVGAEAGGLADHGPATRRTASPSEREAAVLEAVRVLVRATASEVAQHCKLANGTTYVALKALVAGKRVGRTETSRGIEYSLVSSGQVQPFKRPATRQSATAAVDSTPPPMTTPIPPPPMEMGHAMPSMPV